MVIVFARNYKIIYHIFEKISYTKENYLRMIQELCIMELPEDVLPLLEVFWAEEYESDYRDFIEIEKENKLLTQINTGETNKKP